MRWCDLITESKYHGPVAWKAGSIIGVDPGWKQASDRQIFADRLSPAIKSPKNPEASSFWGEQKGCFVASARLRQNSCGSSAMESQSERLILRLRLLSSCVPWFRADLHGPETAAESVNQSKFCAYRNQGVNHHSSPSARLHGGVCPGISSCRRRFRNRCEGVTKSMLYRQFGHLGHPSLRKMKHIYTLRLVEPGPLFFFPTSNALPDPISPESRAPVKGDSFGQ